MEKKIDQHGHPSVFSVLDYGAAGKKDQECSAAIQQAIDACSQGGGGTVYLPAGQYTSGTIHLRSHVRIYIESGAVLFASKDKKDYDKEALFYGEDLEGITVEGHGTIDGQSEYEWRLKDHEDDFIRDNMEIMQALGKPLMRAYPAQNALPKMFVLLKCRDVGITGLTILNSPSWTMHLYGCERLVIDGLYIHTNRRSGVWADGIDPDGCKDVRIANCTIDTGDDAIVFYSMNWFGPALPCENITITNCRLSSSSSALKFCDGNMNCVRNVTVNNCVITDSNRGIAFMCFDGGYVSDVTISNVVIDCRRHDWFWWGDGEPFHFNVKRRSDVHKNLKIEDEPAAGSIRNVKISNIVARGRGAGFINGHPDSWLDQIAFDNVLLQLSSNLEAPYQKGTAGLHIKWARNIAFRNFTLVWEGEQHGTWRNGLAFDDVERLTLDGIKAGPPPAAISRRTDAVPAGGAEPAGAEKAGAAIVFLNVQKAVIRDSVAAEGTGTFLEVKGAQSGEIVLKDNDFKEARVPVAYSEGASDKSARELK